MAEAALIIAIVSAVIAACAAWIAYEAQKEAQKHNELAHNHNKLSVVPHLAFDCNIAPDSGLFVRVRNCGLGPAKIIKFKVYFDKNFLEDADDCGWGSTVNKLTPLSFNYSRSNLIPGESFIVGHEQDLIRFLATDHAEDIQNEQFRFIEGLKKLKFEIEYESFYREKQELAIWDGSNKADLPIK
ncbi:MAG: hypothetical protein HOJ49_00125 [Nitrospina sp.]|jgi:hypothetical protein|nr:hypothetical protein [Nitrospina sp.]